MRPLSKNKLLATIFLSLVLSWSLFVPNGAQANIAGGGVDCAAAQAAGAGLTALAGTIFGIGGSVASTLTSVPISNIPMQAATAMTGTQTTLTTTWSSSLKGFADCLIWKTGQLMLDDLTEQTVNWIKGGMNGSPQFAVDPHKLYLDLSEAVAGNLARQIRGLELCDFTPNFKNDLANWVELSGGGSTEQKLKVAIECPFKTAEVTASQFYGSQQKFAWRWFETALNDNGNPFGVSVIASNELTKSQLAEQHKAEQELNWGSGFLGVVDVQDCPNMPPEVSSAIAASQSGQSVDMSGNLAMSPEAVKSYQNSYCKKTTPGKIIERQLGDALQTDFQRLGLADNLSKIINAFVTKLSNDAIKGIFKK